MMHNRFAPPGQPAAIRKSRLEGGKQSFLPKPRHAGSIDRLSAEIRRPSGVRSSSAEAPRATIGGGRLSREASATKIPLNRRSRSQQGEQGRYGHGGPITPLRTNKYSRATTTPQRTPSEDRTNRNWQTSLDRALAFVTNKDQRPLSNPAWQRSECHRVQEALAARGDGGSGSALIRPLTITRFVDITGSLLNCVIRDSKLTNDNYVTKVPPLCKLALYPGAVSKSWLRTVNTLHAFPHALALIAYLLDLVRRLEMPVLDEWLYAEKDDLAMLRRDYLIKSWIRFQDPDHQFDDLNEEYLQNLKLLLGNDEEKIAELQEIIKKYTLQLEDAAEAAARSEAARRAERRNNLLASLRNERGARLEAHAKKDVANNCKTDLQAMIKAIDAEIERANVESATIRREVETQTMTVAERARLLDEVDYANRVFDSKRALAEQITKMVYNKESELALWQKKTLDSCVQYKHALIHLSAPFPHLAELAIDENDLMGPSCQVSLCTGVDTLRDLVTSQATRLQHAERTRSALRRRNAAALEDTRTTVTEIKSAIERERDSLTSVQEAEAAEAAHWTTMERQLMDQIQSINKKRQDTTGVIEELGVYETQEQFWCKNLAELHEYVNTTKTYAHNALAEAKQRRMKTLLAAIRSWEDKLDQDWVIVNVPGS